MLLRFFFTNFNLVLHQTVNALLKSFPEDRTYNENHKLREELLDKEICVVIRCKPNNFPRELHLTSLKSVVFLLILTVNTRLLVTEKNFIPVKLILSVVTCVKNLETCATLFKLT